MNALLAIAGREIRDGFRNRWILAATLLLGALALILALLGSAPTGAVGENRLAVTVVSLSSLGVFLIPLIALLLSYETFVVEVERGTMLLLLACPVARWQVVFGKFLGHVAILALSIAVGYGAAGLVAGFGGGADGEAWRAFGAMMGTSALLGAIFVAIGHAISVATRDRGTAAGIAVAVWLVFVVLYDMALLGALVADEEHVITEDIFAALLMLNPVDLYRMFNLSASDGVAALSGMAGAAGQAGPGPQLLLPSMAAWAAAPLAAAAVLFHRREL